MRSNDEWTVAALVIAVVLGGMINTVWRETQPTQPTLVPTGLNTYPCFTGPDLHLGISRCSEACP